MARASVAAWRALAITRLPQIALADFMETMAADVRPKDRRYN